MNLSKLVRAAWPVLGVLGPLKVHMLIRKKT